MPSATFYLMSLPFYSVRSTLIVVTDRINIMASPRKDEIEDVAHIAHADNDMDLKQEPMLLKSGHDNLGYFATGRRFWKV